MWCIVPAAGIGSRFGSNLPKQYTEIVSDSSILEYTLNQLIEYPRFEGVMVALHPDDKYWKNLSISNHQKIFTCIGGQERSDSVLHALRNIRQRFNAFGNDWVMVHDAARPGINIKLLEKLYTEVILSNSDGGVLATRLVDTIKLGNQNNYVNNTVDRKNLWAAQTPQMFKLNQLIFALESAKSNGYIVTDEASAIEMQGDKSLIVESEIYNFKITTRFDLSIMQSVLKI